MEWVTWTLRLANSHLDWVASLPEIPPGTLREFAQQSAEAARLVERLRAIAERAYTYALEMDFRFLMNEERKLFAIGFQQTTHSLDGSYYDLLASEARLASFMAIAKNDVPVEHWFHLARSLTHAAGAPALVSWSGSMFEYLMPLLVMRSFPFTMLAQTCEGAVTRQRAYGAERRVPWGVSESAYNVRDRHHTYQYRAFGVPDLALKRGLGRDLVVAPYASVMAAMVNPGAALANLAQLEQHGALGPYGFRDAIDYTRPATGQPFAVVGAYMAHHIGMSLVALTNVLASGVWQRRFHADPVVRSAELLLHERIPRRLVLREPQRTRPDEAMPEADLDQPAVRRFDTPDTPQPHIALLGEPSYTIMVSHGGGGYSRYGSLAVTRWRADGCRDATGQFQYVKDLSAGRVWSAAHQPVCAPPDWYHADLATDRVTFRRADGVIETSTEIAVVPEDSAEVRRVTVTNNSDRARDVEITSYGEIVLAPPEADRAHPAFGNLFVETEWHAWSNAITATRRPRAATEARLWCVHVVATGDELVGPVTCETDRARFVGRGRSTRDPAAMDRDGPLSGTTGAVLDPIVALRARVRLRPGQSAAVAFTTLIATTSERAFELADRYRDPHAAQRALDLAWTSSQIELRELGLSPTDSAVAQELAGYPVLRQSGTPRASGGAAPESRVPAAPLGPRHLGRLADPAGDDRIRRGTADAPAVAGGAPVLAPARNDGGPGRPQRQPVRLPAGPGRADLRRGLRGQRLQSVRPARRHLPSEPGPAWPRGAADAAGDGPGPYPLRRALTRAHSGDRRPGRGAGGRGARRRARGPPARAKRLSRGPRGQADRLATAGPDCPAHRPSRRRWAHGRRRAGARRAGERVRRSRRGWPVRDPGAGGSAPAGSLVQRHRERPGRMSDHRARRWIHLGAQQPVLPAYSLAQRSGERHGERGGLPAGRRDRRPVVGHARTGPHRHRLHRAARPGSDLVRAPAPATGRHTSPSAWPTKRRSNWGCCG